MTRRGLLHAAPLALAGCVAPAAPNAAGGASTPSSVLVYQIVKGVAEVAALAMPGIGPAIAVAIAAADPIAAALQSPAFASLAAPLVADMTAQLTGHTHALLITAAPAIRVVPA